MVGDGGAVLGVEIGVDFVEEVEGRRVALLDGEDEGEGAETWLFCFLSFWAGGKGGQEIKKKGGSERRGEENTDSFAPRSTAGSVADRRVCC